MDRDPFCPACGQSGRFLVLGNRTYRRPERNRADDWTDRALQVLFDVWAMGEDQFQVKFAGCQTCGMMIYLPRPTAEDMRRKYEYVANGGSNTPSALETRRRSWQRSRRIFKIMCPHMDDDVRGKRVLDYGGGDGRLLSSFLEGGAAGDLIDYCERPVAGVTHVGRSKEDVEGSTAYDGVICSHVVEHLADPVDALSGIRGVMHGRGVIYVEVPLEVLGGLPARREPVTHCNFFIPESLTTLLQRAGFRVLRCGLSDYPHPDGGWRIVVGAVARPDPSTGVETGGLGPLQTYLRRPLGLRLKAASLTWRNLPAKLATRRLAVTP